MLRKDSKIMMADLKRSHVEERKVFVHFLEKLGQKPRVEAMKTWLLAAGENKIYVSMLLILSI